MQYIQRDGQRIRETVDEFETRREALDMVKEYRLSDPSATFWISTRPGRNWLEDSPR